MKLDGSVGKLGQNKPGDITLIQEAFKHVKVKTKTGTKALWQKPADGRNGRELEEAITCFQLINNIKPNGKLDNWGPSMSALKKAVPYSVQRTQLANIMTDPSRNVRTNGQITSIAIEAAQRLIVGRTNRRTEIADVGNSIRMPLLVEDALFIKRASTGLTIKNHTGGASYNGVRFAGGLVALRNDNIIAIVHDHPKQRARRREDRDSVLRLNRDNENPGPGDHRTLYFGILNFFLTPSRKLKVIERIEGVTRVTLITTV